MTGCNWCHKDVPAETPGDGWVRDDPLAECYPRRSACCREDAYCYVPEYRTCDVCGVLVDAGPRGFTHTTSRGYIICGACLDDYEACVRGQLAK